MNATWSRRRGGVIGLLVIGATFAWLLFGGLDRNVVFFLTPAELLAKGPAAMDVPVRLGGQVKPGSFDPHGDDVDVGRGGRIDAIDDEVRRRRCRARADQ